MQAKIQLDTRASAAFDRTLEKYLGLQSKTIAEALNKKGGAICLWAAKFTPMADVKKIKKHLKWNKKSAKRLRAWALSGWRKEAAELDNDKDRKKFFKKLLAQRVQSVAYLKSGWIKPARDLGVKVRGVKKKGEKAAGYGVKAKNSAKLDAFAIIENLAGKSTKKKRKQKYSNADAARIYGEPALQAAYKKEAKDMVKYIERKMAQGAKKVGWGA